MLVEHFRVEVLQLAQQYLVFLLDIVGIARNHEEEQGVALDVSEESQSQALSFARSLDNTRDISHHETLMVAVIHDAQRWLEGGKRIVGDLWTGTGYGREQG